MRKWMIALLAGSLAAAPAAAWGPTGHKEVGHVADSLLKPAARAQVHAILDFPLATAGPWMDCLRDVKGLPDHPTVAEDPRYKATCGPFWEKAAADEMIGFVGRNTDNCDRVFDKQPCHLQYHFEDVAIQRTAYGPGLIGTSDHDIVHAINAAIAYLKGQGPTDHFDIGSKREAVLMLAHLVGDIHQPLHVGSIYLDGQGGRIDPDHATPYDAATFTVGGNLLLDGGSNLHSEWDGASAFPTDKAGWRRVVREARAVPKTGGPVEGWAEQWANETLGVSQASFADLSFGARNASRRWPASFADHDAYAAKMKEVQRRQVERAGARLAQILNEIWPSS